MAYSGVQSALGKSNPGTWAQTRHSMMWSHCWRHVTNRGCNLGKQSKRRASMRKCRPLPDQACKASTTSRSHKGQSWKSQSDHTIKFHCFTDACRKASRIRCANSLGPLKVPASRQPALSEVVHRPTSSIGVADIVRSSQWWSMQTATIVRWKSHNNASLPSLGR